MYVGLLLFSNNRRLGSEKSAEKDKAVAKAAAKAANPTASDGASEAEGGKRPGMFDKGY